LIRTKPLKNLINHWKPAKSAPTTSNHPRILKALLGSSLATNLNKSLFFSVIESI